MNYKILERVLCYNEWIGERLLAVEDNAMLGTCSISIFGIRRL